MKQKLEQGNKRLEGEDRNRTTSSQKARRQRGGTIGTEEVDGSKGTDGIEEGRLAEAGELKRATATELWTIFTRPTTRSTFIKG